MELFGKQRLKAANYILAKRSLDYNRKISYSNINRIKSIGIVWDAEKTGEFTILSKFHQKMQERKIDVKILGYYSGEELPDQYTAIRYLSCIRKNELNYIYIPRSTETDVFIRTEFDVLIEINFDRVFPLFYISSLSKAHFKVGLFRSEKDSASYDLMMEMGKPVNVEDYLEQIVHYLEMIKSGSPA